MHTQSLPHTALKLRNYGNGMAEIGWSFVAAKPPIKGDRGTVLNEEDQKRSQRRAASGLRRACQTMDADHLVTLTYRENVTDFEIAARDLTRFIRIVTSKKPTWQYVAVPERQQRGAFHWHIAVRGWQDVAFLRAAWLSVVGKNQGNIDVAAPRAWSSRRADQREAPPPSIRIAFYLSKYISKSFTEDTIDLNTGEILSVPLLPLNAQRYRVSKRIHVPLMALSLATADRAKIDEFIADIFAEIGRSVGIVDLKATVNVSCDNGLAGWSCTW
jgi:hypothetical protein